MVSSINSRMGVTGVIYPAYLSPYSTVFWHLLAVARSGSNRADDNDVAWESARRRKKKTKMDNPTDHRLRLQSRIPAMRAWSPKGSDHKSVPMASNGTWQ
jgi:hypothetical protein